MKTIKKILFYICLIIISLGSCAKHEVVQCDGICINFINKTSADIINPIVNDVAIPNLPFNGESGYVTFQNFKLNHGAPFVSFKGIQNGKTVKDNLEGIWCGFGLNFTQLQEGHYEIEVYLNNFINLRFK